jgi:hypothetical protein
MSAYIAPGELPSFNEAGMQDVASNHGEGSESGDGACHFTPTCHDIYIDYMRGERYFSLEFFFSVFATPPPPEERQNKRGRTTMSKLPVTVRAGLSKRVRGRLSELPTMPLDILYEVRYPSYLAKVS